MKVYINERVNTEGGSKTWSRGFRQLLERRGFIITSKLRDDWSAALFITKSKQIDLALQHKQPVGYRVANGYMPDWFKAMSRPMKYIHHKVNADIAYALEVADIVIYQSKWAKQTLDKTLFQRNKKYAVIYNGVDLNHFQPAVHYSNDIAIIGTVGIMRYRYRLETILEMSRQLGVLHKILIVGNLDSECKEVFLRYKNDPIIGPRIIYQPYLPNKKLPEVYQKMSVLVHPVCGDVCPNVVVEALACGIPVVAPRFGGTAEIIGNAGIIFDCNPWVYDQCFIEQMACATRKVLQGIQILSDEARKQAENNFDINHMGDNYLTALDLPRFVSETKQEKNQFHMGDVLRKNASQFISQSSYLLASSIRKVQLSKRQLIHLSPNPKPRVAFTLFDFHIGGIESWLYRLAYELRPQFDFYFLATKVSESLDKFQNVGTLAFIPNPTQMFRFLQKHNIDIVQVHNERWPVDVALAAGISHVIERTNGTRSCNRIPKQGLSLVIASSIGTVPLIAKKFPRDRIRMIYNGIDLKEVDSLQTKRDWSVKAFVIGRTSRFGRGKNISMLIEAVSILRLKYPQIKLVLIGGDSILPGSDSIESELRTQAASLGNSVIFLGFKEKPIPWIKGFDVGTCVSNQMNEGIPNSLIEAMACSKPVISTTVDQVDELVQDRVNGLLIQPGDIHALVNAIENLITNPELCEQLGNSGRKTIEKKFSLKASAEKYAEAYIDLLSM